jgi:hypothetical protein
MEASPLVGTPNLQRAAPPWGFSERSPSHWIDTGEVPGREGAARFGIGISSRSSKPAMACHRCLAPWAATHGCVGSAPGRRMKAGSSPSYYVSYPLRSLNAASRNPRTTPNTAWRIVAWPKARALAAKLRQLFAGGVVAVDQHRHRPGRDVLDEARQQAANDRRPRQGRLEPRVSGSQDRAVLHVEREADGLPVVAARHELGQDLDVVAPGAEEAFVEGLLERHHHRRDRARGPPRKLVCSIGQACQRFCAVTTAADQCLNRRSAACLRWLGVTRDISSSDRGRA